MRFRQGERLQFSLIDKHRGCSTARWNSWPENEKVLDHLSSALDNPNMHQPDFKTRQRFPWTAGQRSTICLIATLLAIALLLWSGFTGIWNQVAHESFSEARPVGEVPAFRCDLNTAEWAELAQLPGIGQTLAQRIIDRRTDNEPFRHVDQLLEIRGIGEKKLAKIRPYVLVSSLR